jgi:GT2 family glycosyltransferase
LSRPLKSSPSAVERSLVEEIRPTLAVVPAHLRTSDELDALVRCLVSLWTTTDPSNTVIMVVDDGSPDRALVDQLAVAADELGVLLHREPEERGLSAAVNVGLSRALDAEADAVLVHPDVEFFLHGWLDRMRDRLDTRRRPAAIVGGRLLYPDGLVQHGGLYLSLLKREWHHRFLYAPGDLPEAQVPFRCPVSAALQFIRWETLQAIGLYDKGLRGRLEDVDYCLRAFDAGLECIYEPQAAAYHAEQRPAPTPGPRERERHDAATRRLWSRWSSLDLTHFVPEVL